MQHNPLSLREIRLAGGGQVDGMQRHKGKVLNSLVSVSYNNKNKPGTNPGTNIMKNKQEQAEGNGESVVVIVLGCAALAVLVWLALVLGIGLM